MSSIQILEDPQDPEGISRLQTNEGPVLGQWYWVKVNDERDPIENGRTLFGMQGRVDGERLMCAMTIGSNYVELKSPVHAQYTSSRVIRVHLKNFWDCLRHEPNGMHILQRWAMQQQQETARLVGEINALTARLGMVQPTAIGSSPQQSTGGALVTLSSMPDVTEYKKALITAKDIELPALYEHVKISNGNLTALLKAQTLPTLATVGDLDSTVAEINSRIFSISLYAGLHENATLCQDGEPAQATERLHVMQSMIYADEECLANYRHGGLEFSSIHDFDKWLCEPENLERILPFPRTLVALRVRRTRKERDAVDLRQALINFQLEQADKLTFLYVRNGQQVWCIQTELEFDEFLFPNRTAFDPGEPKMAKISYGYDKVEKIISRSEWEMNCAEYDDVVAKSKAWIAANKGKPNADMHNPFRTWGLDDPRDRWFPVDPSSVYFDDAEAEIASMIQKFNRVAVIIQGLFDRSPILHPHPPVKSWTQDGFDSAIKLIYDGAETLYNGEAPDFEAYRARCNATLKAGSMTIGQEDYWELAEGKKESERLDKDYRNRSSYRPTRYTPFGNPGPGYIAPVQRWSKAKGEATFRWERKRLGHDPYKIQSETVACNLTVPASELFNVDAYVLGDFRRFYTDRRTRAQYLKWAPMLIAAEEHHYKLSQQRNGNGVDVLDPTFG
ncbi:hypothetical protein V8Z74_14500 [Comamonas sp. w2-DMI]|uniref:hypothetical protein n=1 Tax=Comamonas sp. w2-DMI TaxID=3126391 RepID=UPI0032E4EE75